MKLKLTAFFLFVALVTFAQKQIQPYTLTKEGKSIIIYASAESPNKITFSLKDERNEPFKDKSDEEILFEVFPFTEIIFKSKLKEAIGLIETIDDEKKITSSNIEYDKESRNIYTFFNALVITAFQYDTEPVAGVLKYSLNSVITKNNIGNLPTNTDRYFRKLRKKIKSKSDSIQNKSMFQEDEFVTYLKGSNYINNLKNYDIKKLDKRLKELYNSYRFSELIEGDFLKGYIGLRSNISRNENTIKTLESNNKKTSEEREKLKEKISTEREKLNKQINVLKDEYVIAKSEGDSSSRNDLSDKKNKLSDLNEKILAFDLKLKLMLSEIELKIDSKEKSIKNLEKKQDSLQREINKLIVRDSNKEKIKGLPLYEFEIKNIELDINNGFIEHIIVVGKVDAPLIPESLLWENILEDDLDNNTVKELKKSLTYFYKENLVQSILGGSIGKEVKFVNEFPLGFSSRTDYEDLFSYKLKHYEGKKAVFSIPVSDVIKMYIQKHQNERLDFSPKNQVVSLPSDDIDGDKSLELKKEVSSKILAAKIYTDFLGFQEANPNGLVQVEVEKNIPLWTKRIPIRKWRGNNAGFFNYVNFNFSWSRIEDREEEFEADSNSSISYLDLIRFKNTSLSLDLNLTTIDFPQSKLRVEANGGVNYGRVKFTNEETVGYFTVYPELLLRIRPEERFGGYIRGRALNTFVPGEDGDGFSAFNDISDKGEWLHQVELSAFYTPSIDSDNKFFFRYRYTNTTNENSNGFSEFQVGYQMYLKF